MTTTLPQLDGSTEAAVHRLGAWLDADRADALGEALESVRQNLDEATMVVASLGSAEECENEGCTRAGDVSYLAEELANALRALRITINDAEAGEFASTADRIRRESA